MQFLETLFFRRPRILNQLHRVGLVEATSQTNEAERAALARYAAGANKALEIGTYQGVSAVVIAQALAPGGVLYCVDPWPARNGKADPNWLICERTLRRAGVDGRIKILRAFSSAIIEKLPTDLDFAFVDGDHSSNGIKTDWQIVASRVRSRAIICLHDAVTPPAEPWRQLDSMRFFEQVILKDDRFDKIDIVHSMAVMQKR